VAPVDSIVPPGIELSGSPLIFQQLGHKTSTVHTAFARSTWSPARLRPVDQLAGAAFSAEDGVNSHTHMRGQLQGPQGTAPQCRDQTSPSRKTLEQHMGQHVALKRGIPEIGNAMYNVQSTVTFQGLPLESTTRK